MDTARGSKSMIQIIHKTFLVALPSSVGGDGEKLQHYCSSSVF